VLDEEIEDEEEEMLELLVEELEEEVEEILLLELDEEEEVTTADIVTEQSRIYGVPTVPIRPWLS